MTTITELFEKDKERAKTLTKEVSSEEGGLFIDYSKTHLEESDLAAWEKKLEGLDVASKVKAMFAGERVNYTEERQVLHTKLRSASVITALKTGHTDTLDQEEKAIVKELLTMKRLCADFSEGRMLGAGKTQIKNVVGIGIGGSDLGPRMLTSALSSLHQGAGTFRYVSNVDAQEIEAALSGLNLTETVFVVVSKTFTTQETLENAKIALQRVLASYSSSTPEKEIVAAHFLGVTAAKDKAVLFGIDKENILDMWDYVGGRYSLWSCVSLTSAMAMGFDAFLAMLSGASCMDTHFLNTPVRANLPMVQAMVECKYYNEYGYNNKCIVPYDYFLRMLPAYLQQCEMESNGKSATKTGKNLISENFTSKGTAPSSQTGAIIWGGSGTDVQHSYFQLLHQGTVRVLTEFLVPATPRTRERRANTEGTDGTSTAHDVLVSNCLAQSRALMLGKGSKDLKDRYFPGDRPSITLMYSSLSPYVLGMLIAHYEHKIFIQGLVWEINSFDQFGVELGKVLAKEILGTLESGAEPSFDASTSSLLARYREKRGGTH
ncbi:glucose-6-phosphate isomerase [Nematocida displodere]|uniref:Glucose-6-phosphate isomerase n=1 Tax=Nematocida displodere TaxID=1805483 RepID=A0A177EJQ6_9MICR|nr:glucose-6-phosphate isomerase [Nematocida displodere]